MYILSDSSTFNIKYLISAGILKSLMTVIFNSSMLLYTVHYNNFNSAEKCVFSFFENGGEQVKTVEGKHTVLIYFIFFEYFNVNETYLILNVLVMQNRIRVQVFACIIWRINRYFHLFTLYWMLELQ